MIPEPVLILSNLTKTYTTASGPITVLHDVSLSLVRGTSCGVIGPSGSGKTTLLALAAGLDTPSQGSVQLLGEKLSGLSEDDRSDLRLRSVGFIFQSFQLVPSLTALENVMLPAELLGERRLSSIRTEAHELLERVGLAHRYDHCPRQLSGGEQQRVGIARSLINSPALLFADEPTGNLDGETASHVLDLLFEVVRTSSASLLCVTHDLAIAARLGRSITLKNGAMVAP